MNLEDNKIAWSELARLPLSLTMANAQFYPAWRNNKAFRIYLKNKSWHLEVEDFSRFQGAWEKK